MQYIFVNLSIQLFSLKIGITTTVLTNYFLENNFEQKKKKNLKNKRHPNSDAFS